MGKERRTKRVKVVLDTNIWVSLILSKRIAEILGPLIANDQKLAIYMSYQMLAELARVLTYPKIAEILRKANLDPRVALAGVVRVVSLRTVREGTVDEITSDDSDNRVLECAVQSKVSHIVTGDGHLLELKEFKGIKIMTARDFLVSMKKRT